MASPAREPRGRRYARDVRAFTKYTLARLGLFVAAFAVIWVICFSWVEWNAPNVLLTMLVALAVSALLSFVLLRRLREQVAEEMATRAERISAAIERSRSAEDDID